MRRRIELYIDGTLADLSEQSFVLFNYAITDLTNPTAVNNSWTQQVTLPGTPQNNTIFGHYGRTDRRTALGFNALVRTPFTIYADTGDILQDGYCRLDEVTRDGDQVTGYKVTLFGGLGSFFYGLSYRADGEKMTLADLDYLGGGENELDFTITKAEVQAAWTRLAQGPPVSLSQVWDVINFAPLYEGAPEGDFDADKLYGANMGLSAPTGYSFDSNSATVLKMPEKVDMWAVKDLRSYLQRPVVSFRAILEGIAKKAAANGYVFDYTSISDSEYNYLWKTLPSIPSLGTFRQQTGALTATLSPQTGTNPVVGKWALSGLGSYTGVIIDASLCFRLYWNTSSYNDVPASFLTSSGGYDWAGIAFVQVVAYAGAVKLKGSQVLLIGPDSVTMNAQQVASLVGYVPTAPAQGWAYYGTYPIQGALNQYTLPGSLVFNLTATGATRYELVVTAYELQGHVSGGTFVFGDGFYTGGNDPLIHIWNGVGTLMTEVSASSGNGASPNIVNYSTPQAARSGAALGKSTLLHSQHSPADYLLGWAKLNGLVFRYDSDSKTVTLQRRDTFYDTGYDPIDLSRRLDPSQGVTVTPMELTSKWYDFGEPLAMGAFAQEYAGIYGQQYGWQRVNTGYDFDSAVVNLLAGTPFRAAVSKTAHGKYWNMAYTGTQTRPSPLLYAGCTYTAWDSNGNAQTFDAQAIGGTATVNYYNGTFNNYDLEDVTRLELCNADGKPIDGEDILCEFQGMQSMQNFRLSDDSQGMEAANGGRPCWSWTWGGTFLDVPTFSRYAITAGEVTRSLDFGTPREVDIPAVSFADGSSLYERRWQAFMADRLDLDTKVLRAKVNLRGLQVGPDLFRMPFWYDGALWCLNSINNYSLTTWDLADCEFVQVQDWANYDSGQL